MSYFLTTDDIRDGRKVIYRGRVVTPVEMAGATVKLAETGQWAHLDEIRPLVAEQIHEDFIRSMLPLVEGRSIAMVKTLNKGFELVLEDNTRVSVSYGANGSLNISITDPEGERIL